MIRAERVSPLANYLVSVYGDTKTVSEVSGIPEKILTGVYKKKRKTVPEDVALQIADFVKQHRRPVDPVSSEDFQRRYATSEERAMRDKENTRRKAERTRVGY